MQVLRTSLFAHHLPTSSYLLSLFNPTIDTLRILEPLKPALDPLIIICKLPSSTSRRFQTWEIKPLRPAVEQFLT